MSDGTVVLALRSYWHAGSGRGDGPGADAVIVLDRWGLPYLPGRTVKGLVRAAVASAVTAGAVPSDGVDAWFGTDHPMRGASAASPDGSAEGRGAEEARYRTKSGTLQFGSATMGEAWRAWALSNGDACAQLVRTHAATKLEHGGIPEDETLRVIQLAVPVTLRASVANLDDEAARVIGIALPLFLRGLGAGRRRGLGRVTATLEVS